MPIVHTDPPPTVSINTIPHGPFAVGNDHYFINRMEDVNCMFDHYTRDLLGSILDNMVMHQYMLDCRHLIFRNDPQKRMLPIYAVLIMSDGDISAVVQNGRNQFLHRCGISHGRDMDTGKDVFCSCIGHKIMHGCGRWKFAATRIDTLYQSVLDFNDDSRNINKIAGYVWPDPMDQKSMDSWKERNKDTEGKEMMDDG